VYLKRNVKQTVAVVSAQKF